MLRSPRQLHVDPRPLRMVVRVLLLATLAAASARGQAASGIERFKSDLDSTVAGLMRATGAHGVAVAVIEGGRVSLTRTYGWADRERLVPVTRATTFNAASVSKAATAWGVMRLVQDGRIGLDDPISKHVRRWRLPSAAWSDDGVTVRRLLSHTAGVNRGTTGIWDEGEDLPSLEAALSGDNNGLGPTELQAQPGTRFSYSGAGYSMLQLLIEEVTGRALAPYLDEHVLRPLGMRASEFGWTDRTLRTEATPYSELRVPLIGYRTVELAAGGLNTTIDDLARFAAAHAGSTAGGSALAPQTVAMMMAPVPATDSGWGLGLARQRGPGGRWLIGHEGGNPGWGSVFRIDQATGDGLVVLTNRSWGAEVYYPLLCEWRNATARGTPAEPCHRSALAAIAVGIIDSGLVVGRTRFETLVGSRPAAVSDEAMGTLARRFVWSGREADAVEILRWNVRARPSSSRAHELLGDALLRAGDAAAGRERLSEAVRLDPSNGRLREKLERAGRG